MSEWQPIETAPKDGTKIIGEWSYTDKRPPFVGEIEYRTDWWWPLVYRSYTGWAAVGGGPTFGEPTRWMPIQPRESGE